MSGNLVDVHRREIYPAVVECEQGHIREIRRCDRRFDHFLVPGFVDSHIHIESSMLVPSQFARAAVVHGTVGTVSDPHEIANVLGESGIRFMLEDAAVAPLKISFGVPSCVPATQFETAGAKMDSRNVERLLDDPRLGYLAEMMNYPGVLTGDSEVLTKIRAAHERNKPVDGHAPGLRGIKASKYIASGITTDHECMSASEAMEKIGFGAKIQIRQGSAARNFDALHGLIDEYPDSIMFCSDDKHPDDLVVGHIDELVRESVKRGHDLFHVLRAASVNPVEHYGLDIGLLREGDPADCVEVNNLSEWKVLRTIIDGQVVAERGEPTFDVAVSAAPNRFFLESWCQGIFGSPYRIEIDRPGCV